MKREITLNVGRLKDLFHYDQDTGIFTRRVCSQGNRWKAGEIAGTVRKVGSKVGYVSIKIDGYIYLAHRLAWLYMTGQFPSLFIDHIDGSPGNNSWCNLRLVTQSINMQNIKNAPSGKKYSPLIGAHWCAKHKLWKSSIRVNGRAMHLGTFETDVDASAAYVDAKRRFHDGCTI